MDKNHRKALRQCRSKLVKDLSLENELWDKITDEEIFTPLMLEYIQAKASRPEKVRQLLDDLERRGPNAYGKFLYCLDSSGHGHLADIIRDKEQRIRNGYQPVIAESRFTVSVAEMSRFGLQCSEPSKSVDTPLHTSASAEPLSQAQNPLSHIVSSHSSPNITASGSVVTSPSDEVLYNRASSHHGNLGSHDDNDVTMRNDNTIDALDSSASSVSNTRTEDRVGPITSNGQVRPKHYKMASNPRGYVLIINNILFSKGHHRPGAERDGHMLMELFPLLGFQVDMKENKTAEEMDRLLLEFSQLNNLHDIDSVIVVLMSHGNSEVILGIDNRPLRVLNLIKYFDRDNCPAMRKKPKMFIINACRGPEEDQMYRFGSTEPCMDRIQSDTIPECLSDVFPANSDIVLAYSTFPGFVSYRDPMEGSWFIQNLVEVFREEARDEHVMDMLTQVNDKVACRSEDEPGFYQTPAPMTTLRCKWYLNPPS